MFSFFCTCSLFLRRQSWYSGCLQQQHLFILSLQHTILNHHNKKKERLSCWMRECLCCMNLSIFRQSPREEHKKKQPRTPQKKIHFLQATPRHTPHTQILLSIVATVFQCKKWQLVTTYSTHFIPKVFLKTSAQSVFTVKRDMPSVMRQVGHDTRCPPANLSYGSSLSRFVHNVTRPQKLHVQLCSSKCKQSINNKKTKEILGLLLRP